MKLRNAVAHVCVTVLLLAMAGCGGAAEQGSDTFVLAVADDPQNLDPHGPLSGFRANSQLTRLLYDPLVNVDPDGNVLPGIAKSWRVSGTTIVLQLRDDVTCSDGERVTASTVAANLRYVADPKNTSPTLGIGIPLDLKFSSDDAAGTVTLRSSTPPDFVLLELTNLAVVCSAGLKDRKMLAQNAAGTGPYTIAGVAAGSEYRLARRAGYSWGPGHDTSGEPPASIVVRVIPNETTAANLLLSGQINAAEVRGSDQARLKDAGLATHTYREPVGQLGFNERKGHLTADKNVRTALVHAVDLDQVSKVATRGSGIASKGMFQEPPVCGGVTPGAARPAFDRAGAESRLGSAGWKRTKDGWARDGQPLAVTLIYPASLGPTVGSAVELVAGAWRNLGVKVTAKALAGPEWAQTRSVTGDWDAAWAVTYPQVPTQLVPLVSGAEPPNGTNRAGLRNADYVRLSTPAGSSSATCADWNKAEMGLYTSVSIVPLDDIQAQVYTRDATFAVSGIGGLIVPSTLRMA